MRHSSLALALLFACSDTPPPQAASGTSSTSYSTLSRADFNRQAQERNVGVYWTSDDGDNALSRRQVLGRHGLWPYATFTHAELPSPAVTVTTFPGLQPLPASSAYPVPSQRPATS